MKRSVLAAGVSLALAGAGAVALPSPVPAAAALPAPEVVPTPAQASYTGESVALPTAVEVVTGPSTDPAALGALVEVLGVNGVTDVDVLEPGEEASGFAVVLAGADDAALVGALGAADVPQGDESYALAVREDGAAVGGRDGAGQFYGVQTLAQLAGTVDDAAHLAVATIEDHPAMSLRGTIEGFYGEPWTHAERLDHLDFLGSVKANTYIYAPKDDPYHRDQWREPYPAEELAELGELVARADANHVQLTFAVSPGVSICYSDPEHRADLKAKLDSIYDLGGRSFYVALDDIAYTSWNCAGDEETYGAAGRATAAAAQVDLLNDVQQTWVAEREGVRPLQMVPTEYGDLAATAYKDVIRETLDPAVVIQWTGTDVVPRSITNADAQTFAELYGRNAFLWDNYPVNDFGDTAGRLLLGPYAYRDNGLSEHLTGIVSNPMNQPHASDLVVASVADFAWNDTAFDAETSWRNVIALLAGHDARLAASLEVFADLNRLAPTFGSQPWQPQAPALAAVAREFWAGWDAGQGGDALVALAAYADELAAAPGVIRASADAGFVTDADNWLDAAELWGDALTQAIASIEARMAGDAAGADELAAAAEASASAAADVRVDPLRNRWPASSRVKVGDGVLDVLVADLLELGSEDVSVTAPQRVLIDADGAARVPVTVANRFATGGTGFTVTLAVSDGATVVPVEVAIGDLAVGESTTTTVDVTWPGAPAARAVVVTATVDWEAGEAPVTTTVEVPLQASCARTGTSPVGVHGVSSEETEGEDAGAVNAIDGDPTTFWHTAWSASEPTHPHTIDLDLGEVTDLCALTYQPRTDASNGQIDEFEVYLSRDGESWGEPVAGGSFGAGLEARWVPFQVSTARYVRLVALSEVEGRAWATAAEITVDVAEPAPAPTEEPTEHPTPAPTQEPTGEPTQEPTDGPTGAPTNPVPAPTGAPAPTSGPGGDLPSTGAGGAGPYVGGALALLLAGLAGVGVARRRAQTGPSA
ncbi:beta-N-acetylglucosaminidase domain-containing protein [Georgenia wangjunii]|uniref:beta-N-acetylglucosaminidase domain-containing protein n=1 Tax=Georgenia wangjunii TaxID=3117730 RepID=UPI002F26048A